MKGDTQTTEKKKYNDIQRKREQKEHAEVVIIIVSGGQHICFSSKLHVRKRKKRVKATLQNNKKKVLNACRHIYACTDWSCM